MTQPSISPRERVQLVLQHKETDRIPIALPFCGMNPHGRGELEKFLKAKRGMSVDQYFESILDIKQLTPDYIGPELADGTDIWGVRRENVSYGKGSYKEIVHQPLGAASSVNDIAAHRWPDPNWFDYESLNRHLSELDKKREYAIKVRGGAVFESAWFMRGFENLFMDLATEPEMAHAIFERITEYNIRFCTNVLRATKGRVDLIFTADDIAGQNGMLLSVEMWREHIKPYHERLNRAIHELGAKVVLHVCGGVMDAVEGFIEMGVDVLQALQFDAAGMDPVKLKTKFGDRLCFEGGVSVQKTLPFGTAEDVREEVRERMRVLGTNGGYILGPAHIIQDGTPPENIVAMFDEASGLPICK